MRLGIAVDHRIRRVIAHDVPAMLVRGDVVRRIERRLPDLQGAHLFGDLLLDVLDPAPCRHVVWSPVMGDAQGRLPPRVFHRWIEIEDVRLQRQGGYLGVHAEAAAVVAAQVLLEPRPTAACREACS